MSWDDTAAVRGTIQTVPILATATFISRTPDGVVQPVPYVVIHPADGTDAQSRFTGPYSSLHPEFTLHIVGDTAELVQAVTGLVKAEFVVDGFVVPPAVDGRTGKNGYWRSPLPIQVDNDVSPALIFQVIELGWTSDPA